MLALKARCMEEGDSMKGGDEVAGLKEGRLPVRTVFALGVLPSKALNACTAQPFVKQPDSNHGHILSCLLTRCHTLTEPSMILRQPCTKHS